MSLMMMVAMPIAAVMITAVVASAASAAILSAIILALILIFVLHLHDSSARKIWRKASGWELVIDGDRTIDGPAGSVIEIAVAKIPAKPSAH